MQQGIATKTIGSFEFVDQGEGKPIIVLHGLMGGLSNFSAVLDYFSTNGYQVIIPVLPLYDLPLLKTTVKEFASYIDRFMKALGIEKAILLGNSLGGHVGLVHVLKHPQKIKSLTLTGSSGLFEKAIKSLPLKLIQN